MKHCPKCDDWKPLDEFHRSRTSDDGRNRLCASCVNARLRAWRDKKRAELGDNEYTRQSRAAGKTWRATNPDRQRLYNRARNAAVTELIARHRTEYQRLYQEHKAELEAAETETEPVDPDRG